MKMKYNRSDLSSTIRAAQKAVNTDGKTRYIFATYAGYTISTSKPFQNHYAVTAATVTLFERKME